MRTEFIDTDRLLPWQRRCLGILGAVTGDKAGACLLVSHADHHTLHVTVKGRLDVIELGIVAASVRQYVEIEGASGSAVRLRFHNNGDNLKIATIMRLKLLRAVNHPERDHSYIVDDLDGGRVRALLDKIRAVAPGGKDGEDHE